MRNIIVNSIYRCFNKRKTKENEKIIKFSPLFFFVPLLLKFFNFIFLK